MPTQTHTEEKFISVGEKQKEEGEQDIPVPRGEVQAKLVFYSPPKDGAVPYNYIGTPSDGMPERNFVDDIHEVTIHDIRGQEQEFDVNECGFGVLQEISSAMTYEDFGHDEKIEKIYYPEVEQLLLHNVPGAKRIHIFDHTVRRSDPKAHRAPVSRAHIDQTTRSANIRVDNHMGEEAEELKRGRVRLINVWRPLNGPVVGSPLAYADSRSVPDDDIVPVEHRYPHRTGETASVKHSPQGKWYYCSGVKNDERVLLQCYDSRDGARTPHSAFVDPRTKKEWPGRESIEVRALVFG